MARSKKLPSLPVQQLVILSICRFAEPIALTSVFPYLPEMIESFGVSKNDVSMWAGITSAVFSLSQATTGILWGRASDKFGRKPAILCAMLCIMITSIMFGFSKSLPRAIVVRALTGAGNGNVGTMRTTVAELVPQKELQPRAFSIMPLVWTIGSILGPAFGGALADPANKYPKVLGKNRFLRNFPFALPNIVAGSFFLIGLTVGFLFLKETLETKKHQRDYGRALGLFILKPFQKGGKKILHDEQSSPLLGHSRIVSASTIGNDEEQVTPKAESPEEPTYREVFSYQSNLNLLTYSLLALHSIAYDQLLPIFMHYPRQKDHISISNTHLTFQFTGGFGIDSDRIGLLFVLYGIVGMFIQFLIFPPLARRWGVLNCLKMVAIIFPITYVFTPFTALFPTPMTQQIGIFLILLFKCWAVIFAFPCTIILLTNSATSVRILGTLNGVAVSTSALGRALGPAVAGYTFTVGMNTGYGILPWWILAFFAVLAAIPVWWLVEMDGIGDAADDEGNGETDDELPSSSLPPEGQEPSTGIDINDASQPKHPDYSNANFPIDDPFLPETQVLARTFSHSSKSLSQRSLLRRISSPIGMKDNEGPGDGKNLSNGLGQSSSGYGTGGTSYH